MSMTLATTWVRRGVAARRPKKYDVDEAELGRISKLARLQLEDAQEGLKDAQLTEDGEENSASEDSEPGVRPSRTADGAKENEDLTEYNLDDYDNEQPDEISQKFAMFGNIRSLTYHTHGEDDPYLVLPDGANDSDEEREDLEILPTDNLILAAKVEDEVAHLEVLLYEDDADNLYVHHDIMLPAVPLCVEWVDMPVGAQASQTQRGNFVAIGTMSPEIEIWDLDVIDSMYPDAILGSNLSSPSDQGHSDTTAKNRSKSKRLKPKANDEYHVDAVLALAANRQHRNLLASASADKTIKLWDLNTCNCAKSYFIHTDKVCALDWHPKESTILLSGSYDRTTIATDMRAPDIQGPRWRVDSDVERVRWDIHNTNYFYVTTEAGAVYYFDSRAQTSSSEKVSKSVWMLQAHDGPVSAFDINPVVPGFLATGSEDKMVKLWNVQDNKPSMVVSRNGEVGRIFTASFAPDPEIAFRLSIAGSKGQVQVWDTSTNAAVRKAFAGRLKLPQGQVKERFIGASVESDSEESDDEGGDVGMARADQDGFESMDED